SGGTFTDFAYLNNGELTVHKVLSTPSNPDQAILQGIEDLGISLQGLLIVHGTTVATNAVLERKGAKTVYITNKGLGDILTIGRQARKALYSLRPMISPPPVPADLCLEIDLRHDAQGNLLNVAGDGLFSDLVDKIKALSPSAVAINLLYSYLESSHEKQIAERLPDGMFVSCSSEVLQEYKEYERGIATWLNAYVGPLLCHYFSRLVERTQPASLSIMQSSGQTMDAGQAGNNGVRLLLSGPAGGLSATRLLVQQTGCSRLLTFDMGGTSTDVALIDGEIRLSSKGQICGLPVSVPMVDMHTIGAGGGSIASVDAGGMLQVGPESAGADPGPACYGKGGTALTVSDANLYLKRIRADAFLGGTMSLDSEAARVAVEALAASLGVTPDEAAHGVIRLANEHMGRALKVISVQQGYDPREFTLVSFGGAGGLHVCALADLLGMRRAIIPVHAGVFSALGMLVAPKGRELSKTINKLIGDFDLHQVNHHFQSLLQEGSAQLLLEGVKPSEIEHVYSVELRYQGQSHNLRLDWQAEIEQMERCFHELHDEKYGHRLNYPVELVNLRVSVRVKNRNIFIKQLGKKDFENWSRGLEKADETPSIVRSDLLEGQCLIGPALVVETVATSYIAQGWQCVCDKYGNLLLERVTG
ncbi:MAG: hydantoinase/oxoprolinase family protein, partial [Gammaproteobacteria bacterium]|nr:hydantoinase/oxoprolinase family protein [Gammaproteobacteria bacterium]